MYKIDEGEWKEYNQDNLPSLGDGEYQLYLKIDGGNNYNDIYYNEGSPITLTVDKKQIPTETFYGQGVNVWPEIKQDQKAATIPGEKQNILSTNEMETPEGCKLMYKIDEGEWKEYNQDNLPSLGAGEYQLYLKIDGGNNYNNIYYNNGEPAKLVIKEDSIDQNQNVDTDGSGGSVSFGSSISSGTNGNGSTSNFDTVPGAVDKDTNSTDIDDNHHDNSNKNEKDGDKKTLLDIKLPEATKTVRYVSGYPDGTFKPSAQMTRAEVVQIIYNLISEDASHYVVTNNRFEDVGEDAWYSNAVLYMSNSGIVSGYRNKFSPDSSVTRAEMAQILYNVIKSYDKDSSVSYSLGNNSREFTDLSELQTCWVSEAIEQLASNGIINGYEDGTFRPAGNVTRAEAVAMIFRLFGRESNNNTVTESKFIDLDKSHWAFEYIMDAVK